MMMLCQIAQRSSSGAGTRIAGRSDANPCRRRQCFRRLASKMDPAPDEPRGPDGHFDPTMRVSAVREAIPPRDKKWTPVFGVAIAMDIVTAFIALLALKQMRATYLDAHPALPL
jgi:hypothetical protein